MHGLECAHDRLTSLACVLSGSTPSQPISLAKSKRLAMMARVLGLRMSSHLSFVKGGEYVAPRIPLKSDWLMPRARSLSYTARTRTDCLVCYLVGGRCLSCLADRLRKEHLLLHNGVTHHSELLPCPHADVARNENVATVAAYHRDLGGCRVKVKVVECDALQLGGTACLMNVGSLPAAKTGYKVAAASSEFQ